MNGCAPVRASVCLYTPSEGPKKRETEKEKERANERAREGKKDEDGTLLHGRPQHARPVPRPTNDWFVLRVATPRNQSKCQKRATAHARARPALSC